MKVAVYNGLPCHYEVIAHVSEYCKLRGHELVVYSTVEKNWGWFDYYGITPLPVEQYSHKEFDYVILLTDDDWSFPVTPDEKIIFMEHTSYQRRSGDVKRVTFKSRPGVPHIYFTFSVPKAPKTLRVCVLGVGKDLAIKYPVEVVQFYHGKPVDATEMMKVISSCQYMSLLNSTKPNSTSGAISMAFTCGCRLITTKNIIDEYGLKSAIDYDATDELVSIEDTTDIYEEAERMIKQRNRVYDSIITDTSGDFDFIEIGTSDFETEIQYAGLKKGISIEPVKRYLDALPNPPYVTKIHGAVSNRSGTIDVYSLSLEDIQKYNLPDYIRGCNSVNAPHICVAGKVPDEIIIKDTVPVYTFSDIINMCHVKSCKYLKIDTEGHDVIIVNSYLECVSMGFPLIPKIMFEDNGGCKKEDVDAVLEKLVGYGYTYTRDGWNVFLDICGHVPYHSLKSTIDQHLSKIKAIVDATGEPCEGNVFWLHFDPEHQEMSTFLNKRLNLFNYSQKAQSIMEIGFNAGHSSLLYMLSNPTSTLQLFDLGAHSYTRSCFDYLSSQFPNRMKIEYGDSCQTVPAYVAKNTGKVFDMIHIDGGHDDYVVRSDILNSIQLSDEKTVIISDDDEQEHIARINRQYFEALPDALPSEYQYVGKILSPPYDYDFIEIGTSDFETEIQDAGLKRGISIEPVKRYLDALPNPPHVTKIHGAASNRSGTIDVYSISPENIIKHNLPDWTRGCNSVNAPHKGYAGKVPDEIFTKDTVPVYTFTDIINMCHVKSCKYLKIDTEGHDAIILQSYVECLSKGFPLIPKIIFEDFGWSEKEDVDAVLENLVGYGYTYERTPCGGNIILVI